MIRLFKSKTNKFWPIARYIFGKYSLRAFQKVCRTMLKDRFVKRYKTDASFQKDV